MASTRSREDLESWLEYRPRDWAQILATRAALRALPYGLANNWRASLPRSFALELLRTAFIADASWRILSQDMTTAAERSAKALRAARASRPSVARGKKQHAVRAADAAAYAAARAADVIACLDDGDAESFDGFIKRASFAAHAEAYAAARNDWIEDPVGTVSREEETMGYATVWSTVAIDCQWLTDHSDPARAARALAAQPLWIGTAPARWTAAWNYAAAQLLRSEPSYQPWVDWYDRRIVGHSSVFDLAGDGDRIAEWAVLARLLKSGNREFWSRGPLYVNVAIQDWLDRARRWLVKGPISESNAAVGAARGERTIASAGDSALREAMLSQFDALVEELKKFERPRAGYGDNRRPLDLRTAGVSDAPIVVHDMKLESHSFTIEVRAAPLDRQMVANRMSRLDAIKAWLAEKFRMFGKAAFKGFAAAFGATAATALLVQVPRIWDMLRTGIDLAIKWLWSLL